MLIYADNAATTAVSKKALEAMLPYFTEHYGNASSIHRVGQASRLCCRQELKSPPYSARLEELILLGGKRSDTRPLSAALQELKGKKHIISSKIEHHAVLHVLDKLEKEGYDITSPRCFLRPVSPSARRL